MVDHYLSFRIGAEELRAFRSACGDLHYSSSFVLRCLVNKIANNELDIETLLFPERINSKKGK